MYELFVFIFQNSFLMRGVVLFILGLIIGSLLNVIIYRLPIILEKKWRNNCIDLLENECQLAAKNTETFNLFYPPSFCRSCKNRVPIWTNIPLIGFLLLNGKCFHCKAKISLQYPIVELLTSMLFVLAGFITNNPLLLAAYLVFISLSICIVIIDFRTLLLPDELTIPLLWAGLLFNMHGMIAPDLISSVIGAVVGYLLLWVTNLGFKLITKKDGMGYGDFNYLAAILAWLGYQYLPVMLLIASGSGIIYYVAKRLFYKMEKGEVIPFAPFIGIASFFCLFMSKYLVL